MSEGLVKGLVGTHTHGQGNAKFDDARHCAQPSLKMSLNIAADAESAVCLHVAQTAMKLVAAYVVPSITTGANGTNFISLDLSKGNLAAGALTSLDVMTTAATALTARTKRSFSIDPVTDTLAKGDGLYLNITHPGTGAAAAFTIILDYELVG